MKIIKVFRNEIIASLVLVFIFIEEFFYYFILRFILYILCHIKPSICDATFAIGMVYTFFLGLITFIVVLMTVIDIIAFDQKSKNLKKDIIDN